MTEKVHWKTAKKLAEQEVVETVETPKAPEAPKVEVQVGRPYRVFDNRAGLVGQVSSLEEAEEELKKFVGGFIKMV